MHLHIKIVKAICHFANRLLKNLAKKRINTTPEYIQIISGAQQGIDIVARAILKRGIFICRKSNLSRSNSGFALVGRKL